MSLKTPRSHIIYTIAIIGFIYTTHAVLPMYSNSSFLNLYVNENVVGYIYMLGAAISILGLLLAPNIIRNIGNYKTAITLVIIQMILFWGMIGSTNPMTLAILFGLQTAVIAMIGLTVDIFLEKYSDGEHIGTIRGMYTATLNASWVIAPLIGTMLINGTDNYRNTYIAALAMLFPLLYLIYKNFPRFKDPNYIHLSPFRLIKHVYSDKNWIKLFWANIILQVFYAWMVIYSAIYLNKTIGFSWEAIGIILTIMLLPFPLIQYPLGRLSDKKFEEKKIMSIGFMLIGISTIFLSFFTINSVVVWSLLLFITRLGAAASEIMIETYFFKTVSPRDSSVLGLFRLTRPLSYLFAPLITVIGLLFTTDRYLFIIVGLIVLIGIYPASTIKDIK